MPVVRIYDRQVNPSPLPSGRRSAAPTLETFGASIGTTLSKQGMALYQDEMLRQDQVAVVEAERRISAWELKRLYDPKEGAFTKRGKDAFGLPDAVSKELDTETGAIRNSLTTDRQRVAFDRAVEARRSDINRSLTRHVFTEVRKFDDEETKNFLLNSQQAAVANANDPERVRTEIDRQRATIMDFASRNGLGGEYVKQATAQVTSNTHVGVVERMLASGKDMAAKSYVTENRGEIAGDDIAKVEKWIEEGTIRGESQRQADAILKSSPSRDAAMESARAIKDPKLRDAVETRVNNYWSLRKQAEGEQREQVMQNIANVIDRGGSIDSIPMSQWNLLSPSERSSLRTYQNVKARGQSVQTDWGKYYSFIDMAGRPETRDEFAKTNLLAFKPHLDEPEWKHLVEVQRAIRSSEVKQVDKLIASERVQKEIVDGAIRSMGFRPNPDPEKDKKASEQVVAFRRTVREMVASKEQQQGRNATDKEVQEIVDNLIVQGVTKERPFWFDETARVFELKEGDTITIKASDVPKAERDKITAALKRQGRAVTDEAITTLYTAKVLRDRGIAAPREPSMSERVPQ